MLYIGFVLLTFLSACSSIPESEKGFEHVPSVGSQFTIQVIGGVGTEGALEQKEVTFSVQVADMILQGKEQVVQFAADTLISLIAYESNGDLSLYMYGGEIAGCRLEDNWLRLPCGSDEVVNTTLLTEDECLVVWNARPSGGERVIINDSSYQTKKIHAELRFTDRSSGSNLRTREYLIWYAPELGYVVREQIISLVHVNEQIDTIGLSERVLTEFSLKNKNERK